MRRFELAHDLVHRTSKLVGVATDRNKSGINVTCPQGQGISSPDVTSWPAIRIQKKPRLRLLRFWLKAANLGGFGGLVPHSRMLPLVLIPFQFAHRFWRGPKKGGTTLKRDGPCTRRDAGKSSARRSASLPPGAKATLHPIAPFRVVPVFGTDLLLWRNPFSSVYPR